MPQIIPCHLSFVSGFRVGTRGINLEEASPVLPSDTLFAALVDMCPPRRPGCHGLCRAIQARPAVHAHQRLPACRRGALLSAASRRLLLRYPQPSDSSAAKRSNAFSLSRKACCKSWRRANRQRNGCSPQAKMTSRKKAAARYCRTARCGCCSMKWRSCRRTCASPKSG